MFGPNFWEPRQDVSHSSLLAGNQLIPNLFFENLSRSLW